MMMECPRCGFTQPKDRYCANCGLDVESFVAKPKPLLIRIMQNPNLHLSLIGILIVLVVGYIFYSQGDNVKKQMGQFLNGLPILSRDAGDPNAPENASTEAAADSADSAKAVAAANPLPEATSTASAEAPAPAPAFDKLDISSWEIPKEALAPLISGAERVGEGNAGRVFLITAGEKVSETIQLSGHRLSTGRTIALTPGTAAQIEAPMAPTDPFQFGFYAQIMKNENRIVTIKWDSTLILPSGDSVGGYAAGAGNPAAGANQGVPGATAPPAASMRPPVETMMSGRADLKDKTVLLVVFEPSTRNLREDLISRAGEGPWTVFLSETYRASTTDWVTLIELK
jgi:hypothetical protein